MKGEQSYFTASLFDYSVRDKKSEKVRFTYNKGKQTLVIEKLVPVFACGIFKPAPLKIHLKTMLGFLLGSNSLTFKMLPEDTRDEILRNSWRFLSLITSARTYDFEFEKKRDLIDFIIAVNHVTHSVIPHYPAIVSRKLLNFMILKQRLYRIAKICHLGRSIKCLFLKSLYKIALNLP